MTGAWLAAMLWCVVGASAIEDASPVDADASRVAARMTVAVPEPEVAADAIIDETVRLGGWFAHRTDAALSLRVPEAQVEALLSSVRDQGEVLDQDLRRIELADQLVDGRARLDARRQVVEQYFELLDEADSAALAQVERETAGAIGGVEALARSVHELEHHAAIAVVDISFRFETREPPTRDGTSSFAWLNTLNLQDLRAGLQSQSPGWSSREVEVAAPPDGFAAYLDERAYRAVAPDQVVYRVRTMPHDPVAELPFWQEAVKGRMEAAGYTFRDEGTLATGGLPGAWIEVAAALGSENHGYLIVFMPVGELLVVAEAAGPVLALSSRRADVLDGVGQVGLTRRTARRLQRGR